MFHGQPYCANCGYEGPDFLWMWHHVWGFQALVQDQASLELRTVEVPDHAVFYRREGLPEAERQRARDAYVAAVIAGQLRPGERHVAPAEFGRFAPEGGEQPATDLPCPRCRTLLRWRHTGIS
jgi:hypothetical protein